MLEVVNVQVVAVSVPATDTLTVIDPLFDIILTVCEPDSILIIANKPWFAFIKIACAALLGETAKFNAKEIVFVFHPFLIIMLPKLLFSQILRR